MDLMNDQELLNNLVKKAQEDAAFKNKLIKDPIATIEIFAGHRINIPQGKKVVVSQTDSSAITINVLTEAVVDDMELNEEQLDIIAGGGDVTGFVKS